jgi:hypothetical protein
MLKNAAERPLMAAVPGESRPLRPTNMARRSSEPVLIPELPLAKALEGELEGWRNQAGHRA